MMKRPITEEQYLKDQLVNHDEQRQKIMIFIDTRNKTYRKAHFTHTHLLSEQNSNTKGLKCQNTNTDNTARQAKANDEQEKCN